MEEYKGEESETGKGHGGWNAKRKGGNIGHDKDGKYEVYSAQTSLGNTRIPKKEAPSFKMNSQGDRSGNCSAKWNFQA